jgi:hypothetical protein
VLALEVLVPLLSHELALHDSIQRDLAFLQLLKDLEMPLLYLPQILLEDGMILLESSMFSLKSGMTFLKPGIFGLQTLEPLGKLRQSLLCSISGLGGIRSLTLHHGRVLAENSEILLHLSYNLFKFGILPFNLLEPCSRGLGFPSG